MARVLVALVAVLALTQLAAPVTANNNNNNKKFDKLVAYLSKQNPTLVKLLTEQNLVGAIKNAVKSGTKLTIFAPSENAFRIFKAPNNVNLKDVLKDHVVPQYLPASEVVKAPQGTNVATLGPNRLWKLKNVPLRVGFYKDGKVKASAKVVWADAYKTNSIVVHRINRVLAY